MRGREPKDEDEGAHGTRGNRRDPMNSTASAPTPTAAVSGLDLVDIECQNRYSAGRRLA